MRKVYLDNNATTPLAPEVKKALHELEEVFGNPSSVHWAGREAKRLLNVSREKMASLLGVQEGEILFTSGGTESINTAILAVWKGRRPHQRVILSSPLEHQATLQCLKFLKTQGAHIQYLEVDRQGRLHLEGATQRLNSEVLLVSLLLAHNEIGNLYPLEGLAELCRDKGILFHADAVQALGKVSVHGSRLPVDLLSFSAHKFHGPKGVGGLYVRKGVELFPLHYGGKQERGRRGGTENLLGIYGMALALECALQHLEKDQRHILFLRERLEKGILENITGVSIQGDPHRRLPNTTNILFKGVDGESLLMSLDLAGVAASAGSACESGSLDPSPVIRAMGFSEAEAKASIRFSLSKYNTELEIDEVLKLLPGLVKRLRK